MLNDLYSRLVTQIGRRVGKVDFKAKYGRNNFRQSTPEEANAILSVCDDGMHAPCIDLDFPAYLIASSTPGHFHLYIDKKITWPQYRTILNAFKEAGLIQDGWWRNAMQERTTTLRLPHIRKEAGDAPVD